MKSIEGIKLDHGAHPLPVMGMCLMEAVSYVAGLPHSDQPACVSRLLASIGRNINDAVPDDLRQELVPLIPYLPGTAGDGLNGARREMALDWFVGTYTSAWLELAGYAQAARELRDLESIAGDIPAAQAVLTRAMQQHQGRTTRTPDTRLDGIAYRTGQFVLGPATQVSSSVARAADSVIWPAIGRIDDPTVVSTNPTVIHLQRSLIDLYTRMVMVGRRIEKLDVINHVGELVTV